MLNKYRVDKLGKWHNECVDFIVFEFYSHEIEIDRISVSKLSFNGTIIES